MSFGTNQPASLPPLNKSTHHPASQLPNMADSKTLPAVIHWDPEDVLQLSLWSCAATTKDGRPCPCALNGAHAPRILFPLSTLLLDRPANRAEAAAETTVLRMMARHCLCAHHHGAASDVVELWAERLEEARRLADLAAATLLRVAAGLPADPPGDE